VAETVAEEAEVEPPVSGQVPENPDLGLDRRDPIDYLLNGRVWAGRTSEATVRPTEARLRPPKGQALGVHLRVQRLSDAGSAEEEDPAHSEEATVDKLWQARRRL